MKEVRCLDSYILQELEAIKEPADSLESVKAYLDSIMTYSDVKENGWVQSYKPIYTMRDFHRLHKKHDALTARFILMCSVAYYQRELKKECRVTKPLENVHRFMYMDL